MHIRSLATILGFLSLLFGPYLWAAPIVPNKSPTDDKLYRGLVLENQMKVLLISDPDTDQAAASLDVNVGSGDDPREWNGLAHFLEHMLFLGTGKYPTAGEYQKFIQSHGGSNNAYTSYDHTNYFFSIEHNSLEPALDRFSRFFIDPTFEDTYVSRERSVVHSEYQARLKDEGRRIWAAQKQILDPSHPGSRFSVGSKETLRDREDKSVRGKLIEFYQKWYSANIMTLTVLGRESLDELEALVRERFSEVPNHDIEASLHTVPYFNESLLPVRLNIVPIKDVNTVSFAFPIPSLVAEYQSKPLSYIANLLGHEGEGSLLSVLKSKGWADSLSAGSGFMDRYQGTFNVSIGLTEPGLAHIEEIGSLLFYTIHLIRENGVEPWRFAEEQQLGEISFQFAEEHNRGALVQSLSSRLHSYPLKEVISGPYLMAQYRPERIIELLGMLAPERVVVQVVSTHNEATEESPWYGVPYAIEPIGPALVERWSQAKNQSVQGIQLPDANPFIPSRLALGNLSSSQDKPMRIDNESNIDLWYQPDQEFQAPRANFYFSVKSEEANRTPRHTVLTDILVRTLNDQLNAATYPARLAGLGYRLYRHSRGISTRISGYEDKQGELLKVLLAAFQSPVLDPDKFALIKAELIREFKNSYKERPSSQTIHEIYRLLLTPYWTEAEKLAAIEDVTLEDLAAHGRQLFQQVSSTALAHGDIEKQRALELGGMVAEAFIGADGGSADQAPQVERQRVRKLDKQTDYLRTMDVDHNDTAMTIYIQGRDKSIDDRARMALLGQLLESPFYFDLRTTHRVGYLVFGSAFSIRQVPGLVFSVQSPTHTVAEIYQLIGDFLDNFPAQLAAMDEAQFEQARQGLISQILKRDNKLVDRSSRYWEEIDLKEFGFDTRNQLAEAIQSLDKATVATYFEDIVEKDGRRLIVQTPGNRNGARNGKLAGKNRQETGEAESFRESAKYYFPQSE